MAWRIHDSIVRGEIDNRQKGVVRGRIWLAGIEQPIVLELAGNGCADLAGCLLKFTNHQPPYPMRKDAVLVTEQRGRAGEMTASRKVRVYDVPFEEADELLRRGEKPPEHLANSLYLEWFSLQNGRVVIESSDYKIEISPPEWQLTPADERQRQEGAEAGWAEFAKQLDEAVRKQQQGAKDPDEEWDEHEHERFLKESDARTNKYMELLDKYGHSDEAHDKVAKEMGWERELTDEEAVEEQRHIEELNAACEEAVNETPEPLDPTREGIDWIRTPDGDIRHPLYHRCFEAAVRFSHECKELGLDKSDDVAQFVFELQVAAAKLAGALGDIARGWKLREPAFTVAYLKRALDHLHQSLAGLEAAVKQDQPGMPSMPPTFVAKARSELFGIREEILRLMQELRGNG